jgi:hypothetical protein
MYLSDEVRKEIAYFKRLHEHFVVKLKDKEKSISEITDERILYIVMSASYSMDIFEEGFFENFVITDKALTGKDEIQIDAYALIETESSKEKHLHIFQYKLFEGPKNGASPVDVNTFVSLINELFVHTELRKENALSNEVFKEIDATMHGFLNGTRGRKITVKCHFITNAVGISKTNARIFDDLLGKFERDKQLYGFGVQIYGEREILDLIRSGKINIDTEIINFNIDGLNSYRLEDNSTRGGLGVPNKVFIGICNVNELIRLQNKYHHNQLYSDNIRLYLGDRAAVNKDIIETVTSQNSLWFPYMNNGISIICDDMSILNAKHNILPIELNNIQIINGCQTVNALYNAKYSEKFKDKFKPEEILVKIYQIDSNNTNFKHSVIKASNNQNSVKNFSLLSNDPIQVAIQEALKKIGYIYDRKGEARGQDSNKIVSMVNAALAYRACFRFEAQKLRAGIGQGRVFRQDYYNQIYKESLLTNDAKTFKLASQLLSSSIILDAVRDYIKEETTSTLPIIKKSAYYLAGIIYALNNLSINKFITDCVDLIQENNPVKNNKVLLFSDFQANVKSWLPNAELNLQKLFDSFDKKNNQDIDNILKSTEFDKEYQNLAEIKAIGSASQDIEIAEE